MCRTMSLAWKFQIPQISVVHLYFLRMAPESSNLAFFLIDQDKTVLSVLQVKPNLTVFLWTDYIECGEKLDCEKNLLSLFLKIKFKMSCFEMILKCGIQQCLIWTYIYTKFNGVFLHFFSLQSNQPGSFLELWLGQSIKQFIRHGGHLT